MTQAIKKKLHQYHQELTVPRILGLFSRLRRSPSRSLALHSLRFHIQYPRVSHKIASQIRNTKSISIRSFPTAMHCDTNRNRKASSEEKISKTEKSKLRKAGSGISRSELYAVVSVSVCPSLSLSLSRSLSVRVCL
jgi:hypothetical protein